jgi:hypothetical protein
MMPGPICAYLCAQPSAEWVQGHAAALDARGMDYVGPAELLGTVPAAGQYTVHIDIAGRCRIVWRPRGRLSPHE